MEDKRFRRGARKKSIPVVGETKKNIQNPGKQDSN
jgi:hypothetical protein